MSMTRWPLGTAVAAGICFIGCSTTLPASAQSVEQFYKSNQLVLLVGHDSGGGYDVYTRTLARHMVKHIPGHPNIVVKNMLGAGGLRMINHLYAAAPRDGSTFGISDRGYVLEPILGNKGAQFDASQDERGRFGRPADADLLRCIIRREPSPCRIRSSRKPSSAAPAPPPPPSIPPSSTAC